MNIHQTYEEVCNFVNAAYEKTLHSYSQSSTNYSQSGDFPKGFNIETVIALDLFEISITGPVAKLQCVQSIWLDKSTPIINIDAFVHSPDTTLFSRKTHHKQLHNILSQINYNNSVMLHHYKDFLETYYEPGDENMATSVEIFTYFVDQCNKLYSQYLVELDKQDAEKDQDIPAKFFDIL